MSYTVERLTNPDVIYAVLEVDFDPKTDILSYYTELITMLDDEARPITTIISLLDIKFSIGRLLETTADLQKIDRNPANHPMSKQLIMIATNPMMKMSVDGFRKFGILKTVHVVKTFDEALTIVEADENNIASA